MLKKLIIGFILCNIIFPAFSYCIRNPQNTDSIPPEWQPFVFDDESGITQPWGHL